MTLGAWLPLSPALPSVVTATSQAANQTLQTLSQQQSARMAATEKATLAQMEQLSAERLSSQGGLGTRTPVIVPFPSGQCLVAEWGLPPP